MQTYSEHQPTAFDRAGAFLRDQQNWLLVPVSQTRDSQPIDQSNFDVALEMLGGESETVEVHRFGHWGPGWYEIIIIDPEDKKAVAIAEDIEQRIDDYPLLDEDNVSEREYELAMESWDNWGFGDTVDVLVHDYELGDYTADFLLDVDRSDLYHELEIDFYIDGGGPVFNNGSNYHNYSRKNLAAFIWKQRAKIKASA